MGLKCKFDLTYVETKVFISEVRCILSDLQIHGCDVLPAKAACTIVSNIVFTKLPAPFRQEIGHKVNNCYPTLHQIFDNHIEVIETLNLKKTSNFDFETEKQFVPKVSDITPMVETQP